MDLRHGRPRQRVRLPAPCGFLWQMCNNAGFFDMSQLDHAGLAGVDPLHAVTFVENHDTDGNSPI